MSKTKIKELKRKFLRNLKGNKLKYKRYLGAPIKYAGGKSLAVGHIIKHIPNDIKKVVSPFLGGGSIEIAISNELGIPVIGYDIFEILINFWDQFINNKNELVENLKKIKPTKENYNKIKKDLKLYWLNKKEMERNELAWKYYFNHNLSYGPGFLGWMSSIYSNENKYNLMIERLSKKKNKNIKVFVSDFSKSIPKHQNDFLYLDPPYYLGGSSKLFKGIYPMRNIPIHHKGFNHKKLCELLKKHKGGFILSYNDCKEIREFYKDYKIINLKWQYTMGQGETRIGKNRKNNNNGNVKESSEILIISERRVNNKK